MGQYYYGCSLKTKEYVCAHDIKERFKNDEGKMVSCFNGLKLMEHSWIKNSFMRAIESLLIPGGKWHKHPIVWAGDYADNEPEQNINLHTIVSGGGEEGEGIDGCIIPKPLTQKQSDSFRFIVNHTKKTFVDKTAVPDRDGWIIHPLSLLTAEGNGSGGGDFRGNDPKKLIGSWARDIISIEKKAPADFKEIFFNLVE